MKNIIRIKNKRGENGAAVVEFVLVLPLLITILFGIIEFSVILYDNAIITNASREGARYWVAFRPDDPDPSNTASRQALEKFSDIEQKVLDYAASHLISFGPSSKITLTTKIGTNVTTTTWAYNSGDVLTVNVEYDYDWLLLPAFIKTLTPPLILSAETVMRAE